MPVLGNKQMANKVADFAFLRGMRGMPRIRPVTRTIGNTLTFDCKLPDAPAIDQNIRAVIFDGGPVDVDQMSQWITNVEAEGVGETDDVYREHSIGAASAALFGSIEQGKQLERPYADIEVVRVLDKSTGNNRPDYVDVLHRIDSYLAQNQCDFVNLSLGPDWAVEDAEPHAWSSVLDRRFYEQRKRLLPFCAVGNLGGKDWDSGLARVQPPSDCVNAIAVGSCNSVGTRWKRSTHSCVGPGRTPGRVRPEMLAFGGEVGSYYFVIGTAPGTAVPVLGTSYASPTAMRAGIGVRACLGAELQPMAIRALMVHRTSNGDLPMREVGWGRMEHSVAELLKSDDHTAHIIYQKPIKPGQWISAEIPMPPEPLTGMVDLSATICYTAPTEPEHPINYTEAGLEARFRPHIDKKKIDKETKKPLKKVASRPLFTMATMFPESEAELREDFHKWENVLHVKDRMNGKSLKKPTLEIHYNAREGGAKTGFDTEITFALVVTIRCVNEPKLYDKIVTHYRSQLQQIKPIRVPAGYV